MSECRYVSLTDPEIPYLNLISRVICVISTLVNFLGFYLILKQSKRESKIYITAMFGHQLFLYLAQTYWSIFQNVQVLLPFPAFICRGFLASKIGTYHLAYPWMIMFNCYVICLLSIVVVRLKIIVRPHSYFNFPNWFLISGMTLAGIFGFLLVAFTWYICSSSDSFAQKYMSAYFPECIEYAKIPGIMLFFNNYALKLFIILMFLGPCGIVGIYFVISLVILFELQMQTRQMSRALKKHHMKVIYDIFAQVTIKTFFQTSFAFWALFAYFIDPQTDTKIYVLICHSLFVFSPIPGTIAMILQNADYLQFLRQMYQKSIGEKNPNLFVAFTVAVRTNNMTVCL